MLTDTKLRSVKPLQKPYKLSDGAGLYILVTPSGNRLWRFKFRFGGKERLLALGSYPDVSIKAARQKLAGARELLASGTDPSAQKAKAKRESLISAENTFEVIAREWAGKMMGGKWTADHAQRVLISLEHDIFPDLGKRPIAKIDTGEVLRVIRKIEQRGTIETAQRVLQRTTAVFRYAVQSSRIKINPCTELRGALQSKPKVKHRAALAAHEVPEFLEKLENYNGQRTTVLALRLLMLTFVRPGELRAAKWADIDMRAREWRYHITKTHTDHIVPLSTQALAVLKELRPITGVSSYLFPHDSNLHKTMSENTLIYALYRMGYHNRATAHGFRATARTILDEELQVRPDFIEQQLAHMVRDPLGRAYNRTKHLSQRHKMMQRWADYLDQIPHTGDVVPFKRRG